MFDRHADLSEYERTWYHNITRISVVPGIHTLALVIRRIQWGRRISDEKSRKAKTKKNTTKTRKNATNQPYGLGEIPKSSAGQVSKQVLVFAVNDANTWEWVNEIAQKMANKNWPLWHRAQAGMSNRE